MYIYSQELNGLLYAYLIRQKILKATMNLLCVWGRFSSLSKKIPESYFEAKNRDVHLASTLFHRGPHGVV